jgi:Domain of unknown function (DUF4124)
MAPVEDQNVRGVERRGSHAMRNLALGWIVSMALGATPALAQVYKWVDEGGRVSYGDKPPHRSKAARPLDEGSGLVSVVPGIPKEELERLRERSEQQRLQQLEREVDELRAREQARANAAPEIVYTEVYVPAYGYRWPSRRFTAAGHPGHRPYPPIDKPGPPARPRPLPSVPRWFTPG